jgi:AraC family transcriptional regulator, transcriptional activator of the genes for pyochelin and ferripyochelin receptors
MPLDSARTITTTECDELWAEAVENGESDWHGSGIEYRRTFPPQLGLGEHRLFDLQHGLEIYIETAWYWRPLYLDYQAISADSLLANFYLEGNRRMVNPGIQIETDREEMAGENCLFYSTGGRAIEYYPAEQQLKSLSIAIDLDRLHSFGYSEVPHNSPLLRQLIQGQPTNGFHQSLNHIDPIVRHTLHQILNCPYQGMVKRMYLESKAIELLAMQFHYFNETNSSEPVVPHLNSADIERLHLARDILQQNFDNPPSLMGLAKQVGLNDYKLKQGFRHLFGRTVFGYVHSCRMQQAQELLIDRNLSIATVAQRVGYASTSQFSHAFKRYLDMTPRDYRRQLGTACK